MSNPAFYKRLRDNIEPEEGETPTDAEVVLDVESTNDHLWVSVQHPESGRDIGEVMIEVRGGAVFAHVTAHPDLGNDPTKTVPLAVLDDLRQYARETIDQYELERLQAAREEDGY